MIRKVVSVSVLVALLWIATTNHEVEGQRNASSSILNGSIINSGIVKGIGSITSRITSPLRGAAGTVIEKVGGALPGRAGLVAKQLGNCLGTDEWTDPYIGVVKRDGPKYCDPNCGRIISGFLCCIPQKPEDIDVKFHVFSRGRDHTPNTLNWKDVNTKWDYLNNPTKVVIATHGYLERANPGTWIYDLKNGWLKRDASHVIIVDWKRGNRVNYFQAASNVRVIGMMVGQIILRNDIADKTLAVGFSLGAQIIGEAGKFVKNGGAEGLTPSQIQGPNQSVNDPSSSGRNSSVYSEDETRSSGSRSYTSTTRSPFDTRRTDEEGNNNSNRRPDQNNWNSDRTTDRNSNRYTTTRSPYERRRVDDDVNQDNRRQDQEIGSNNDRNSNRSNGNIESSSDSSLSDSPQNRDSLLNPQPQVKNERRGRQMIKECHGLDPAGPFFDGCPNDLVLDKSDCQLVQVIHTSASRTFDRVVGVLDNDFGSWKKGGHCDYWINCGRGPQPECVVKKFGDFLKGALGLESNETVKESTVSCSHGRAPEIYNAELNNTCNFKALDCPNCVEDTNCTQYADSMYRDQTTNYFGFMMDSNCSPNDDKNYFVRTSGGASLCDFSSDRRPNQNTNRDQNDTNRGQSNNDRDQRSTRGYTSTTSAPSQRRRPSDEDDDFRQPNDRNNDRNSNRNNERNSNLNNDFDRSSDRNNEMNANSGNNWDESRNDRSQSSDGRRRTQNENLSSSGSSDWGRTSSDGFVQSEPRNGFFPLINLW